MALTPTERIHGFKVQQPPAPPLTVRKRGPGESPLGIKQVFASPPRPKKELTGTAKVSKRFRFFLALRQRAVIFKHKARLEELNATRPEDEARPVTFASLKKCRSTAIPSHGKRKVLDDNGEYIDETYKTKSPGKVHIADYGDSLGYKWVQTCHSPLLCFTCAPIIHLKRQEEIKLICRNMHEKGYRWLFITFTTPHYSDTNPRKQVKLFNKALRKMKSGKSWQQFTAKYNYIGWIKATEMTVPINLSGSSGPHWHAHTVPFFDLCGREFTAKEIAEIEKYLTDRWAACLRAVGIEARTGWDDVRRIGLDLKKPRRTDDGTKAAAYAAKGAACELSPGIFVKGGRAAGRVSHWDFIALAFTKRPDLETRAIDIMYALAGRHWIDVSPKILKIAQVTMMTDEEIMRKLDDNETIFEFDSENGYDWKKIDKYKMQCDLLETIERNIEPIYTKEDKEMICEKYVNVVSEGYHPETGEELTIARRLDNVLQLEKLLESGGDEPPPVQ